MPPASYSCHAILAATAMLVLASCAHARAPTFAGGSERALLADNPMTMDGVLMSLQMFDDDAPGASDPPAPSPNYYLRSDNFTVYKLLFAPGINPIPSSVPTGAAEVHVRATYISSHGRTLYCNATLEVLGTPDPTSRHHRPLAAGTAANTSPRKLVQSAAGQQDRRSLQQAASIAHPYTFTGKLPVIVYLASFCTSSGTLPAAASVQDIKSVLFGSTSLDALYQQCSGGQARLDPSNTVIFPVSIPCSGVNDNGDRFDTKTCDNDQIFEWVYYADGQARRAGISLGKFYHKIFLFPANFYTAMKDCSFAGLGTTGMWNMEADNPPGKKYGYGITWLAGNVWNNIGAWAHEMGHNYWLAHAGSQWPGDSYNEYGDYSCAMSNGGVGGPGPRCFNAPHMWQMGWFPALDEVTPTDLTPGKTVTLRLPVQGNGPFGVRVWPTSSTSDILWLGFRQNSGLDQPFLPRDSSPSIMIQNFPGTSFSDGYIKTVVVGRLRKVGDSFTDDTGLLVTWTGMQGSSTAVVTLCKGSKCGTSSSGGSSPSTVNTVPLGQVNTVPPSPPPRSPPPPRPAKSPSPPPNPRATLPRPPPSPPRASSARAPPSPSPSSAEYSSPPYPEDSSDSPEDSSPAQDESSAPSDYSPPSPEPSTSDSNSTSTLPSLSSPSPASSVGQSRPPPHPPRIPSHPPSPPRTTRKLPPPRPPPSPSRQRMPAPPRPPPGSPDQGPY